MPTDFMTKQQVNDLIAKSAGGPVEIYVCENIDQTFVFTDSHGIPEPLRHGNYHHVWLPVTYSLPMTCANRKKVPDGMIKTLDEFLSVFYEGYRLLEYVELLNTQEPQSKFLKNERYDGPLSRLPPGIKDEIADMDPHQVEALVAKFSRPKNGEDHDK